MHTPTSHARHADHQSRLMTTPTTQSIGSSLVQHYTPKTKYSAVRNHLTPGNAHYQNTPSPIANPFEADFDHLQHAIMTPGIFQKNPDVTPDSKGKPFQWDIEHVALLNPTDFGDVTEKLRRQDKQSRKLDQLAQGAINKFFEKEHIVPSPWSEPVQKVDLLAKIEEEEKSVLNTSSSRRNASSQTDVHIPLSIDFNELLKAYRLSESQIDELNKGDSFSNSSLRRKLFGNDSGSSDSLEVSNNTPDKNTHVPSTDCWDSPPLTELHSSSPVFGDGMQNLSSRRRCSFSKSPESGNNSPNMSPISSPSRKNGANHSDNLFTSSQDFAACSPDLKRSFRRFSAGISFNLQDEFHLSSSGLATATDSEDDAEQTGCMSVDLHVSHLATDNQTQPPHAMITNHHSYPVLEKPSHNDSVSMCSVSGRLGEVTVPQTSQISQGHNASDTGYQSQMISTYGIDDYSSIHHEQSKARLASVTMSPSKSTQGEWEPPSSSTPNKHPLTEDTHASVWHQL